MRLFVIPLFLLFMLNKILPAQHFVMLGGGYSAILYNSEELDEFTDSYNSINRGFLSQPLDGIDNGMGLRLELGYRYISKWHLAGFVGYISYQEEDIAKYTNGEKRQNKFEHSMMYLEGETGVGIENFFINGNRLEKEVVAHVVFCNLDKAIICLFSFSYREVQVADRVERQNVVGIILDNFRVFADSLLYLPLKHVFLGFVSIFCLAISGHHFPPETDSSNISRLPPTVLTN